MNLIERDLQRGNQDDKWAWKCPECSNVKSIRSGSWFESESRDQSHNKLAISVP